MHFVSVSVGNSHAAGIRILALFPNETCKCADTDEYGEAALNLDASRLRISVFVAADGLSSRFEPDWVPAERALHVALQTVPSGGSVILMESSGFVPGLSGSPSPIHDALGRTYLHTENIAINDGEQQPFAIEMANDLRLIDTGGNQRLVEIVELQGRSVLLKSRLCKAG